MGTGACLRLYHEKDASEYVEVINTFGRDEEKATAGMLSFYFDCLFSKFSYVLFKKWASKVPEINDTERMAKFIVMSGEKMSELINEEEISDSDTPKPTAHEPNILSDRELLNLRDEDPTMPYYI